MTYKKYSDTIKQERKEVSIMKDSYISKRELEELLNIFQNAYDKAYFYLIYEGLTAEEALCVEHSGIDGNKITVNGRTLEFTDECMKYVHEADQQTKYRRYNHLADRLIEEEVCPTDCIIKFQLNTGKPEATTPDEKHARMKLRFYRTKREANLPRKYGELKIRNSGLVATLLPYIEDSGGDVEKAAEKYYVEFKNAATRWGKPMWETKKLCMDTMGTN